MRGFFGPLYKRLLETDVEGGLEGLKEVGRRRSFLRS